LGLGVITKRSRALENRIKGIVTMFPPIPRPRCHCALFFALTLLSSSTGLLQAGTYGPQAFTFPNGTVNLGDGTTIASTTTTAGQPTCSIQNNTLRLMANGTGSTNSSFKLPVIDVGKEVASFDVSYNLIFSATGTPADGYSLNFGAIPAGNGGGEGGYVMPNGLVIAWDTYNNGNDVPSIEVFANGISVGNFPQTFAYNGSVKAVAIHWDASGLDITVGGVAICTNLATSGFIPSAGNSFAFSGRTGGATQDAFIDDLQIGTVPTLPLETGGPVITEFCADNTRLEDEDVETPDWIEIYNGQNASVNMNGWHLTNSQANPAFWTFPSITLGPYQYRIVYASGKNRTATTGQLHTNFVLAKDVGYLALTQPDNTVSSSFTYGQQAQDVSYGEQGDARTVGYLSPPTPGIKNNSLQAPGLPAEELVWSDVGGIITATKTISISPAVAAGAVIRYTTNNTDPTESSAIYDPASPPAAFTVSSSTNLRARVFTPGLLPGPVSSRTFLRLDTTLTNYNGGGMFNSHLPLIVMDSFGVPVDAYTDPGQARPFRFTYAVAIDKDPVSGRASLTGPINFQGRSGTHVRGESSSGFPQRQYAWELWDEQGGDKEASILGMPAESDWVLHAPYTDKSLMRNLLVFQRMFALRGEGSAMRSKFCEVFFNQEAGQNVSSADYRGVYVLFEKIKRNKDRVEIEKLNSLTTDPNMIKGGYLFKKDKPGIGNTAWSTTGGIGLQGVEPELLNTAQLNYISTYMNSFESALNGANYQSPTLGYQAYIDRDSFIDNQWWVEMSKQIDGYRLSTYFTKTRAGKVVCAPLWDYNLSLYNADYLQGDQPTGWYYTQLGGSDYPWYTRLHTDVNYRVRHWDRYWELRRNLWATTGTTGILNEIDANAAILLNGSAVNVGNNSAPQPADTENAVMRHFRKWPILGTYVWPNPPGYAQRNTYQSEITAMKNFLSTRLAWIDDQNNRDNNNVASTIIYRPPVLSNNGGSVVVGTQVTLQPYAGTPPAGFTYSTGTLYYTTNGSDPRLAGGAVSSSALTYSDPITVNTSQAIKARLYNTTTLVWSPLATSEFTVDAVPASASNLVVSELMYHPRGPTATEAAAGYGENDFEYIELLNVSTQNVDLTGCDLQDAVNFDFDILDPGAIVIPPGGRMVIAANLNAFALRFPGGSGYTLAGPFSGSLSNNGELFTLRAANGSVIAQFTWADVEPWPTDSDGAGYSLVLNNPAGSPAYGSGTSWRSSAQLDGSPGLSNSTTFTGSPSGDGDSDGLSDYLEYAMGSNSASAASVASPACNLVPYTVGGVTSPYLEFAFPRNLAADGVTYIPLLSADLATWSSAPTDVVYVGTHNNGDGTATVRYRSAQPFSAAGPQEFFRLKVTQ
jgi:hypothetical protein